MLGVIEYKNIARRSLGCDDARILRHVSSSVHFAFVVDLDLNFNLSAYRPKTTKFYKTRFTLAYA